MAGLVFCAPALPDEGGKLVSPTLGQQLRFLFARGLMSRDDTGLRYIRRVAGRTAATR